MPTTRAVRCLAAAVCAACVLAAVSVASPAAAYDTIPDTPAIAAAKARVGSLRSQAAQVARSLAETMRGIRALRDEIEALDAEIASATEQVPALQLRSFALDGVIAHDEEVLARRAVGAYISHSSLEAHAAIEVVESDDLMSAVRTNLLIGSSQVVETDRISDNTDLRNQTIARLARTVEHRERLLGMRWMLEIRRQELRARADSLRDRQASLDRQTAAAADLVRRLEQEEAQRLYQEELDRIARDSATDADGDGVPDGQAPGAAPPAVPPPPPAAEVQRPVADGNAADLVPIEDLVCPIAGPVSFTNDWGNPRSGWRFHSGTDLFAAGGTPNVAVASGTARQATSPKGGTSIWLDADHGVSYYYAHLSGWAGDFPGGARRVSQGEVVGYTGNTGNAAGGPTHTHFQIHPGGGGAVNPYSVVLSIC